MNSISPQNEQLLRELVATGRFQSEDEALREAIRLLVEQSGEDTADRALPAQTTSQSGQDWLESFLNWSRKPRIGNSNLDDSRESIYGDRGL